MKHIYIFLSALLSFTFSNAQISGATLVTANMSQGTQKGFKILIPEASEKEVIKAWSKYLKNYDGKTSKVLKTVDYITEGAFIPSFHDTAVVIYSNFNKTPEGVYMNVFVNVDNQFVSPANASPKVSKFSELMKKFAIETTANAISEKLEDEKKKLERLEKDQKNLEKDKDGYEKEIKRAKETIETNEKNIVKNTKDQTNKKAEIIEQKKSVNKVKQDLLKYPVK